MLGYRIIGQVLLLLLGFPLCKEVLGRFRSDLEVFRQPRGHGDRGVIAFFRVLTLIIVIIMALAGTSELRPRASPGKVSRD